MDIKQANISETDTYFRTSGCGPVCIQVVPQDPEVHKLATRSTYMDGGCISNKLITPRSTCLPTFCSYRENASQSNERQVYVGHNTITVPFPTMVNPVIENVYARSNFHSSISKSFDRPKPKPTPIRPESNISLSSMEGLWQQYSAEGLSDQTIGLLETSQGLGTLHHYKKGWRKWCSWCLSRKIDPVSAGVNCVLEFLSNLFSEGLEYRTINGYRSAISANHENAKGVPISQHPKVCQFLSGVFNKRPQQPKYTVIWDISKVTDYISTLGSNENLSTKIITLKLTALLAILSSNRVSELTYLDIRHIVFKENSVVFHFSKLTKTWRKGKSPQSFELKGFEKAELCKIRYLKQYLLITDPLRSEKTTQLLISYISPSDQVSVDTVSCWLKEYLRLSGTDTSIFTGHSTRTASASSIFLQQTNCV